MSENVTLGNTQFTLTQAGDPSGWGEEQYDLIKELVASVNEFFGPGDILTTTALIGNGVGTIGTDTTYDTIPFFQFDSSVVRFAEIEYTVIRVADSTVYEVGKIFVLNDPTAVGNPWSLNIQNMSESSAGVDFSINSSGQVTYGSDTMTGTYLTADSKIVFRAKSIIK